MNKEDLLSIGFKEAAVTNFRNCFTYDLGRDRVLDISHVGTDYEVMFLCEKSQVGDHYTDMICIHSSKAGDVLTLDKIKCLIDWFK